MSNYTAGSLVNFRGREWVVLPSGMEDVVVLRPLTGSEQDVCGIYLPVESDKPQPATFPEVGLGDIGDFEAARLLRDAARLLLRRGAGPFSSMGYLSFRPQPYQFVPLLMALRLNPVRMLIADDVGVGKTIEAALIAREMLDRGDAKRLAVLCPPYLCDQWHEELASKFAIQAHVVRSETYSKLVRDLPRPDINPFAYHAHMVISIDFVKSAKHRFDFLANCPDLIIVDEAHGCAKPAGQSVSQQQRHELLYDIAKAQSRHLVLVTATPHSGIEESFLSLLGLIKTHFAQFSIDSATKESVVELSRHFVQRQRGDIKQWMGIETHFPQRDSPEVPYKLSPEYSKLFNDIYAFARESIVKKGTGRAHYWAALALLRCVMSSPAAGRTALLERAKQEAEAEEYPDSFYTQSILDPTDIESVSDSVPTYPVTEGMAAIPESERRKLREFAKRADALEGDNDTKLLIAVDEVLKLVKGGFKPIVFCRFIETSNYVAEQLKDRLGKELKDINVLSVTSETPEEERKVRVAELCGSKHYVLVATDCLSEGINLQDWFDAVIHYDLPWNPNRLAQREGRVDRFGQVAKVVKAILIYGLDNPVDGAVLKVLIRKAKEIYKRLGIMVPVPMDSETVMQSVLKALFLGKDDGLQLRLLDAEPTVIELDRQWKIEEERQRKSRSLFAQHTIKPDEVAQELDTVDAILGDPKVVERFVATSAQRVNAPLQTRNGYMVLDATRLPVSVRDQIPKTMSPKIGFEQPVPKDITYISRTHPLTSALAEYVFDNSLNPQGDRQISARCSVLRSADVNIVTSLLLLRIRYLIEDKDNDSLSMAEECVVTGFEGITSTGKQLSIAEASKLYDDVKPTANVSENDKQHWLAEAMKASSFYQPAFEKLANERAKELYASYERVRKATKSGRVAISPHLPVDMLSMTVVLPQPLATTEGSGIAR